MPSIACMKCSRSSRSLIGEPDVGELLHPRRRDLRVELVPPVPCQAGGFGRDAGDLGEPRLHLLPVAAVGAEGRDERASRSEDACDLAHGGPPVRDQVQHPPQVGAGERSSAKGRRVASPSTNGNGGPPPAFASSFDNIGRERSRPITSTPRIVQRKRHLARAHADLQDAARAGNTSARAPRCDDALLGQAAGLVVVLGGAVERRPTLRSCAAQEFVPGALRLLRPLGPACRRRPPDSRARSCGSAGTAPASHAVESGPGPVARARRPIAAAIRTRPSPRGS